MRLIDALSATGLRQIEAVSFVVADRDPADGRRRGGDGADQSGPRRRLPSARPQRAGRGARHRGRRRRDRGRGQRERDPQPQERAPVGRRVARRGDRCSRARPRRRAAVEAIVSTAFGCPYEGDVSPAAVAAVAARLLDGGADGCRSATPRAWPRRSRVEALLDALDRAGTCRCERGTALPQHARHRAWPTCSTASGPRRRRFDASVGGLGGCPYAPGATGQHRHRGSRPHARRHGHRHRRGPRRAHRLRGISRSTSWAATCRARSCGPDRGATVGAVVSDARRCASTPTAPCREPGEGPRQARGSRTSCFVRDRLDRLLDPAPSSRTGCSRTRSPTTFPPTAW